MGRSAQDVVDLVDLVELVVAGKNVEQAEHLEEDAADAPVVHLVIVVTVSEKTLWRTIPPGRYVLSKWRLGIDTSA